MFLPVLSIVNTPEKSVHWLVFLQKLRWLLVFPGASLTKITYTECPLEDRSTRPSPWKAEGRPLAQGCGRGGLTTCLGTAHLHERPTLLCWSTCLSVLQAMPPLSFLRFTPSSELKCMHLRTSSFLLGWRTIGPLWKNFRLKRLMIEMYFWKGKFFYLTSSKLEIALSYLMTSSLPSHLQL